MLRGVSFVISIGAQPNSSPHFGTLIVFSTAFSFAKKMKEIKPELDVSVLFEVVDAILNNMRDKLISEILKRI